MALQRDQFMDTGPVYLTSVNWDCPNHRRSIAASLVNGVYVLERDKQKNRHGSEALAPAWWKSFHFQLTRKLVDDEDLSIFGAIYEFKPQVPFQKNQNYSPSNAPRFVIAFRGTVKRPRSFYQDFRLDLLFVVNGLQASSRFKLAMQAVENTLTAAAPNNIWLAGHSLGSAVAMLAGKSMARRGIRLHSFLFNPPIFAAPVEKIINEKAKQVISITKSFCTAAVAAAVKGRSRALDDTFPLLSSWSPNLCINPADCICSGYKTYFENRELMERIGAGRIERIATQNSIRGVLGRCSETLHCLPSANLTVILNPSRIFKKDHGIHQWWRHDLQLQSQQYYYQ